MTMKDLIIYICWKLLYTNKFTKEDNFFFLKNLKKKKKKEWKDLKIRKYLLKTVKNQTPMAK